MLAWTLESILYIFLHGRSNRNIIIRLLGKQGYTRIQLINEDSTWRKLESMYPNVSFFVFVCMWQESLAQGININPQPLYQDIQSIKYNLPFFQLRPTLRSRSRVDLDEFFSKQGCIGLADLWLVCKYRHALYFCLYGCIDLVDLWSTSTVRIRLRSNYRLYLRVTSFG